MMIAANQYNVISPEQNLLQEVANGDFAAFENLFKQYYQALCAHALSYTGSHAAAEDAVSEVFARIWEKRGQLNVETSVKSYLYRSVGNQCIDALRKSYHKKTLLAEGMAAFQHHAGTDNTAALAETKELAQQIEAAIRRLPKQCGIVFRLSRDAGLKYQEIAAQLNISVKTVETQMGRAFKALRKAVYSPEGTLQLAS
jgi:RNA polymerase sigma-70 factor (family 1)